MERFTPASTAIVLFNYQETAFKWSASLPKERVIANARVLARLATEMGMPLLITTSMEDAMGGGLDDLRILAPAAYEKRVKLGPVANAFLDAGFAKAVQEMGRKDLIFAGLGLDLALFHTLHAAITPGSHNYHVQLAADASPASCELSAHMTLHRLMSLGVMPAPTAQILGELYPDFGTDEGGKAMGIYLSEKK